MQLIRRILVALLAAAMLGGTVSGGTAMGCPMASDGAAAPCERPGCCDEDQSPEPCFSVTCAASWTLWRPAILAGEVLPRLDTLRTRPALPPDDDWATLVEPPDPPPPR
jgi:hypothetical protein